MDGSFNTVSYCLVGPTGHSLDSSSSSVRSLSLPRPRASELLQVEPPERLDDEHAAARQRPGSRGRPPVAADAQGPRLRAGRRRHEHQRRREHR